jgi:hypothetical protein
MTTSLTEHLPGRFTMVNLGCIGDTDYTLPAEILKTLTVVEIDAAGGAVTRSPYHRKIQVDRPISGTPGRQTFIRHSFAGTCSLLLPRPELVQAYGVERYFDSVGREEVDCETLPGLLERHGLQSLDFLKTDIEGLDAAVIRSCRAHWGRILVLQCELRFEPFYQGEPPFHEVAAELAAHGYEVLDILHIDRWKYKTPGRSLQLEGRAVWADFVFVLSAERLAENFGEHMPEAVAKQVILCCMLGKKNYAEHLLLRFREQLPAAWRTELQRLTRPRLPRLPRLLRALRRFAMPIELFLKHRIGRSEHVSVRLGG